MDKWYTDAVSLGRQMERHALVLRALGKSAQGAARKLAQALVDNNKKFVELRRFKPWTPFLDLVRVPWEHLARIEVTPECQLHSEDACKPEI